MTDTTSRKRQPRGTTVGGQFATEAKSETTVSLSAQAAPSAPLPNRDIEDVFDKPSGAKRDGKSPWGTISEFYEVAPGFAVVSTDSHGGIKLSAERNALVPKSLRSAGGWYEEDCDASIAIMAFPHAWAKTAHETHSEGSEQRDPHAAYDMAVKSVKDYYPAEYTKATGEQLTAEDSVSLRYEAKKQGVQELRESNPQTFYADGWSIGDHLTNHGLPQVAGYNYVSGSRSSDGERRTYLFPDRPGQSLNNATFELNDTLGIDITDEVNAAGAPPVFPGHEAQPLAERTPVTFDASSLSAAGKRKFEDEMDKRYRWGDGSVSTLGERLSTNGARGKERVVEGTSVKHYVQVDRGAIQVPKQVFDSINNLPDTTSAMTPLREETAKAERALKRLESSNTGGMDRLVARRDAMNAIKEAQAAESVESKRRSQVYRDWDAAHREPWVKSLEASVFDKFRARGLDV